MFTSRPALARHASSHASAASLTSNDDGDREDTHPSPYPDVDADIDDGALVPVLAELTFYVVPAKLDLASTRARIEELGGRVVGNKAEARIVVTALKGRPRLERVLGSGVVSLGSGSITSWVLELDVLPRVLDVAAARYTTSRRHGTRHLDEICAIAH